MIRSFFAVAFILCLFGCSASTSSPPKPPSGFDAILDSSKSLDSEILQLRSEIQDLRSEVDRFEFDNWREVVPEIESATSKLESRIDYLEYAAKNVRRDAEEIDATVNSADDYDDGYR